MPPTPDPPSDAHPLQALDGRIRRSRGTDYEADIFSILAHSQYVVRSFEFAPADGSIDCSREGYTAPYAKRYWDCVERPKHNGRGQQVPFEVKSAVRSEAGKQPYVTSVQQQKIVAFYIGICAADPTYVDVIPNYLQDPTLLLNAEDPDFELAYTAEGRRRLIVNTTRACKLPPGAYGGIDQCMSPYRMPIYLLNNAIGRIRECIRLPGTVYVNPWTLVSFPHWRPVATRCTSFLHPAPKTEHHSAYLAVMDILRSTPGQPELNLDLQFVGLQPRLADFKLRGRLIQQKISNVDRAHDARLTDVGIARGDGAERKYYFSTFDRFDFLWYQFQIRRYRGGPSDDVFYFLPERELPDEFYTSTENVASFERANFGPYRIVKDRNCEWMHKVCRIIDDNPTPRAVHERPVRRLPDGTIPLDEDEGGEEDGGGGDDDDEAAGGRAGESRGEAPQAVERQWRGRREYSDALQAGLRRYFYRVMEECAKRKSGLLLVLATNHPIGDLKYCRYRWTDEERDAFLQDLRVPSVAHHRPANTVGVGISYYTQYAECQRLGPMVRARQFRRLDSCSQPRLIAWDIGGYDTQSDSTTTLMIPTADISVTAAQRQLFHEGLTARVNLPHLSGILNSGRQLLEYSTRHCAPFGQGWAAIWGLLDKMTGLEPFQHPVGIDRRPTDYQITLRAINQCLADEYRSSGINVDRFEEED